MEWKQLQAELTNKMRWALGTSSSSAGFNLSYQESQAIATVLAGDALAALKLKETSPDIRWTAASFRSLLRRDTGSSKASTSGERPEDPVYTRTPGFDIPVDKD